MKPLRIAFAGELFSGKDYVAAQVCDTKIGFADPIYAVSRHFNGTDDKKVPGIRRFMQLVGQWGWGHVSEEPEYPHSPVRALLSSQIVALGMRGIFGSEFTGWENFGKSRTLWVDMLLNRLQGIEQNCAITNVRFPHEVEFCADMDIPLYLVECSLETRMERLAAAGSKLTEKELKDTSEKLPGELRKTLPDHQIIWNDHRPMPEGHRYLLVPEFCEVVHHHSDDAGAISVVPVSEHVAVADPRATARVEIPDPLRA